MKLAMRMCMEVITAHEFRGVIVDEQWVCDTCGEFEWLHEHGPWDHDEPFFVTEAGEDNAGRD